MTIFGVLGEVPVTRRMAVGPIVTLLVIFPSTVLIFGLRIIGRVTGDVHIGNVGVAELRRFVPLKH